MNNYIETHAVYDPLLRISVDLYDFTLLVIELWQAARERKPKLDLSHVGLGNSRSGVDEVKGCALTFMECERRAEAAGYWWDGDFYDATESFADQVSKIWAKGRSPETSELESICAKLFKKHMLPPEKKG